MGKIPHARLPLPDGTPDVHARRSLEVSNRIRTRVVVLGSLFAIAALVFVAIQREWIAVPPDWNPWSPLDVAASPNFLTRYKLSRLSNDAGACRSALRASGLEYERLPDRITGENCGVRDAVLIRRTPADVGEEFSLTCRTAVSVALWQRHSLQPAARRHFGQSVTGIEHFGSYSCRNIYGRPDATRSRHATAEAWDIAGFVLADGRRIRVLGDWQSTAPSAAFLRDVRDGACRFFDGVLSPDYNAAHRDHLHFDRGPYRLCR